MFLYLIIYYVFSLTRTPFNKSPPTTQVKGENEAKAAHWAQELTKLRKAHQGACASVYRIFVFNGWFVG